MPPPGIAADATHPPARPRPKTDHRLRRLGRAAGLGLGPEVIAQVSARKSTGMAVAIVPANDRLRSLVSGSARPLRGAAVAFATSAQQCRRSVVSTYVALPPGAAALGHPSSLWAQGLGSLTLAITQGGCTAADAFDVSARSARRLAPAAWVARPQMPRRCGGWH